MVDDVGIGLLDVTDVIDESGEGVSRTAVSGFCFVFSVVEGERQAPGLFVDLGVVTQALHCTFVDGNQIYGCVLIHVFIAWYEYVGFLSCIISHPGVCSFALSFPPFSEYAEIGPNDQFDNNDIT